MVFTVNVSQTCPDQLQEPSYHLHFYDHYFTLLTEILDAKDFRSSLWCFHNPEFRKFWRFHKMFSATISSSSGSKGTQQQRCSFNSPVLFFEQCLEISTCRRYTSIGILRKFSRILTQP
eukprot:m.94715 g.94715  ORF g.94715 m.94715 type:complete len:119 (+) comp13457_c0_seq6:742-1098(+)